MTITEQYLEDLWNTDKKVFKFVVGKMLFADSGVQTDGGGSCTGVTCHDSTGCAPGTPNGYCACASPTGPCVWIPYV